MLAITGTLAGALIRWAVFPIMEKYKGNNTRRYLHFLLQSQQYSIGQLHELQRQKLRELLRVTLAEVPAYREFAGLLPEVDKDPFGVLRQLPVLTKARFATRARDYLRPGLPERALIPNRTGGSTGEPVKFYMDRRTVEYYEAARWRGLSWWGIRIGDPSVMVWGSPIELQQAARRKYLLKERWLKNRVIISAYDLRPDTAAEYARLINGFRPRYLYGYASSLYLFARLIKEAGQRITCPLRGVVSTAENLHDYQRQLIEEVFNCPTINEYGARDGGILAYQCPRGGMHVTAENAVLEVVDMHTLQPLPPGETGLLLVTDLNNTAMPRLRYRIGDAAALGAGNCPCGLNLPLLAKLAGREDDMFLSQDGSFVHGHYFNHIARNLDGIRQFQFIQHAPDRAVLKIVPGENFQHKEVRMFADGIRQVLGPIDLEISYVDEIPPTGSGKYRYAIRNFPLVPGVER